MNWKRLLSFTVLLALLLVGPGAALAADPVQSEALYNNAPRAGTLTGNPAGAFAYYRIDYPGDDRVISIELSVSPGDPATMSGVGINLYGPNGVVLGEVVPIGSGVAILYGDQVQATWLVQVYNYLPNTAVHYSIIAKGLPEVLVATAAPAPTPAAGTAVTMAPAKAFPVSGTLVGERGGAFVRIPSDYTGSGAQARYTLMFSSDTPVVAQGVGLTVYGPDGSSWTAEPTGTPGERRVTFSSTASGLYELVIHNYIPGFAMHYSVSD
jgi:hypothetical protein